MYFVGFVVTIVLAYFCFCYIRYLYYSFLIRNFLLKKYGTIKARNEKPVIFTIVSLHNKKIRKKKNFAIIDLIERYHLLSKNCKVENERLAN